MLLRSKGNLTARPEMATPISLGSIDFGYVQAAHRRVQDMRTRTAISVDPPTLGDLEQALGEPVQKRELLGENWRNRVYRIDLAGGTAVLAKQVVMATGEMLQYQFDQLQALSNIEIRGLRVPKPVALLRRQRVLLMEFARGQPIPALVWNRRSTSDLLVACKLAGKILARLQLGWKQQISALPVEALARDFAAAPWQLSSNEQKTLRSAFSCLGSARIFVGQVYYDYKAANLLFDNGELSLVDPPDRERKGAHLWDYSCFRSSMRHLLWRFRLRRPLDRRAALIRQSLMAFEHSYLANLSEQLPEPALFAPVARIFELQRTAVAMTMQQGKVDVALQERATTRGGDLGGSLANRMTLPLLRMEKRWLFRQLARELP